MRARVYITPKKDVLDPQGKAIEHSLHALGYTEAHDVHLGKYVELGLDAMDRPTAERRTDEMCRKLLANGVIEDYRFEIEE
ncbi:MAG TPA: phosphoribosylformylglycinamidine synthase subunit PurS [Candidatus Margulisiibacteriota bacterium]|nr:phosphoribosylformylglycinamidine synthase subunit PurS [Candidatus Margulisiibacteriota bacterium]